MPTVSKLNRRPDTASQLSVGNYQSQFKKSLNRTSTVGNIGLAGGTGPPSVGEVPYLSSLSDVQRSLVEPGSKVARQEPSAKPQGAPPKAATQPSESTAGPENKLVQPASEENQVEKKDLKKGAEPTEVGSPVGLALSGPPALPVAKGAGEGAESPKSAEEDPAFQAVIKQAESITQQQKAHPPAKVKADEARLAVEPPEKERISRAAKGQVEDMGAKAKPKPFSSEMFKQALKQQLESIQINSQEDAENFPKSDKPAQIKNELNKEVQGAKQANTGPLQNSASEEIGSKAKDVQLEKPQKLSSFDAGPPPARIDSELAVPKPRTEAELAFEDSKKADQLMTQEGITEEQLEKSNEPSFQGALSAKKEAEAKSAEAPSIYRKEEDALLNAAKTEVVATTDQRMQLIHEKRKTQFDDTFARQQTTKTDNEVARAKVATDIENIYNETKGNVERVLTGLDKEVNDIFEAGEKDARKKFEDKVRVVVDRYKGLGGAITKGVEAVAGAVESVIGGIVSWFTEEDVEVKTGLGKPPWVDEIINEGRQLYIDSMETVIDKVAQKVEERLNEAKGIVDSGWKKIEDYKNGLDGKLRGYAEDAMAQIESKFDTLRQSIDDKFNDLVNVMTEKYSDSVKKIDERVSEVRAMTKNAWEIALDFLKGVIKTLKELWSMLVEILSKAANVIGRILRDPITFVANVAKGIKQGLLDFMGKIGEYLQKGLAAWLFGELAQTGITLPESLDFKGILSVVLQVLGLTYQAIRARAVKIVGPEIVERLEQASEIFIILLKEGPAGIWKYIQEKLSDLKDTFLGEIKKYLIQNIIIAGIEWLIGLLPLPTALIKAVKDLYKLIKFIITRGPQIMALASAIIDSLAAIADGNVGVIASAVEKALGKAVTVAIGILASLLGLGGIGAKVREVITTIQGKVGEGVDWVINKAVQMVKAAGKFIKGLFKGKEKSEETEEHDPEKQAKVDTGLLAIDELEQSYLEGGEITREHAEEVAAKVKSEHPVLKSITVVNGDGTWDYDYVASPGKKKKGEKKKGETGPMVVPGKGVALERGQSKYSADGKDRPIEAYGWLGDPAPRNDSAEDAVMKPLKKWGIEGYNPGHMIASELGGSGNEENLVPMESLMNHSYIRVYEIRARKRVDAGDRVYAIVQAVYGEAFEGFEDRKEMTLEDDLPDLEKVLERIPNQIGYTIGWINKEGKPDIIEQTGLDPRKAMPMEIGAFRQYKTKAGLYLLPETYKEMQEEERKKKKQEEERKKKNL